jgi:SAM-dependent methyltransferase
MSSQRILSEAQLSEFYIETFVSDQLDHYGKLIGRSDREQKVIDIGGGAGYLAAALHENFAVASTVWDIDPRAIRLARLRGVAAEHKDILLGTDFQSADVVLFNLVLHHLVMSSNRDTLDAQRRALTNSLECSDTVLVHEYVYQSFVWEGLSAYIIWVLTSSRILARALSFIGRLIPSLNANTVGIGVRFHSKKGWCNQFEQAGFELVRAIDCEDELVSPARRLLFIKRLHRTTFLLRRSS